MARALGELRQGFPGVKVSMREHYNAPLLERDADGVPRVVNLAGLTWKRLQRPVSLRHIRICRRKDRSASPAAAYCEGLLRAEVQRMQERDRQLWGV